MIILLAGQKGAGKTTVARYLKKKYRFKIFSLGGFVRDYMKKKGVITSLQNERKYMYILKNNNRNTVLYYLNDSIIKEIEKNTNICIDSIYDVNDYRFFIEMDLKCLIIYIDCNKKLREKRLITRNRLTDGKVNNMKKFEKDRYNFKKLSSLVIINEKKRSSLYNNINLLIKENNY